MSRRIILIGITILMAFCCVRVIGLERRKSDLKRDRIEMSHIKYGLFNVDEWKKVIADIITKKIKELKITKGSRPAMKREVEDILRRVQYVLNLPLHGGTVLLGDLQFLDLLRNDVGDHLL